MDLFTSPFSMQGFHGTVGIRRTDNGVPRVTATNREDLCYGIGYAHGTDRLVQMMLVRALAQGKASQYFKGSDDLIRMDSYMRWLDLEKGIDIEIDKISPDVKSEIRAYCAGINQVLSDRNRPLEFVLSGYHPEPWHIRDTILTAKTLSYLGLVQTQGEVEKFIIQLIQHDIDDHRIRALFPGITESIDRELIRQIRLQEELIPSGRWRAVIPQLHASNNWVISGKKTASGHPLLAADPHMEVNRLPAFWYEMIWEAGGNQSMGVTLPGVPILVFGRTGQFAWANTYGATHMIDYFIEDCREGEYRYEGEWVPFEIRYETLRPKHREPVKLTFYESRHGILEGPPDPPGKYLALAFAGREHVGAEIFNIMMRIDDIRNVIQAQHRFRYIGLPTFNWVFADREGNIGYQLCGRAPKRPEGISGLLPLPGWDAGSGWQGFVDPDDLPRVLNPAEGYFATANNDVNQYGEAKPVQLHSSAYRHRRILELLHREDSIDRATIQRIQYDTYSKQAERLMPVIRPLLPETENGNLLREWDYRYTGDSAAAHLFEALYPAIIATVFGKHGIGEDAIRYLFDNTSIFTTYFEYFDNILADQDSPWFRETDRESQLREAIDAALGIRPRPYGQSCTFDLENLFFAGKLPAFLGYDVKGVSLCGNRATIPQFQRYRLMSNPVVVGPSYRMIVELDQDGMWTNLPGGPSGDRFSPWYTSDLQNWIHGKYKKLESPDRGFNTEKH